MCSAHQRLENCFVGFFFFFNLVAQKNISVSVGIWQEVNLAYDLAAGRVRGCWVGKWRPGGVKWGSVSRSVAVKRGCSSGSGTFYLFIYFKMLAKGLTELWEKLIPSAWRSSGHLVYPSGGLHICSLRLGRPKAGRIAVCLSALPLLLSHLFLSVVGDRVSV